MVMLHRCSEPSGWPRRRRNASSTKARKESVRVYTVGN
jgi:hypothetical protein